MVRCFSRARTALTDAQILDIYTYDLLIHTWDLSRAIGGDERLPSHSSRHAWSGSKHYRSRFFAHPAGIPALRISAGCDGGEQVPVGSAGVEQGHAIVEPRSRPGLTVIVALIADFTPHEPR